MQEKRCNSRIGPTETLSTPPRSKLDQALERGHPPFEWTKTPDQIIDRICRYCSRISEPAH